jgi:hypothetical protein
MDINTINSNHWINSRKGFVGIVLCLFLFNVFIYNVSDQLVHSDKQARKATSGFSHYFAKEFIYFYYYTGHFPLATINKKLEFSEASAIKEIKENGGDLIMEYGHWSRLGESLRIIAYMPNALLKGSPENPSIKLFNALIFVLSLIVLFFGFWRVGHAFVGFLLICLINVTPFFIYEVYLNENIFALIASAFFITLGVNIIVLFQKIKLHILVLNVLISVICIASLSEIRNEISVVFLSLLLIYALSSKLLIKQKLGLIILVCFTFYLAKIGIRGYFEDKYKATYDLVKKNGGHTYNGDRISGHNFWHPMFCGLGDFDKKYGYEWNDKVAYRYALPVLKEKYGLDFKYSGKYFIDEYYDEAKLYYKKFDEFPEYEEVVKEKVLSDIFSDPLWYAEIIIKRIFRVMTNTIPYPFIGLLLIPLILYLYARREWQWLKLLIISLPLSITPVIFYSGHNATFNSVFPFFIVVLCLYKIFSFEQQKTTA